MDGWWIKESKRFSTLYIMSEDGQVATTYGEGSFYDTQWPNARLIAAAPDGVALAEAVDRHFRKQMSVDYSYYSQEEQDLHKQAQAVLAKAKGK